MTIKEQLIREIEQTPDVVLTEILDFLLFIKERHGEEEVTTEEQANIIASESAYLAGDHLTLDEYEATSKGLSLVGAEHCSAPTGSM
jgi:hypothetical protein